MSSSLTWGSFVNQVEKVLLDEDNDDFSQSELLAIAMNVLREIVSIVPEAYRVLETVQLSSGTKNTIPSDAIRFVGPNRYMGTDGTTEGNRVYPCDFQALQDFSPGWYNETATDEPEHLVPDPDDPATFWSYPPNTGSGYVECWLDKTPPLTTYDAADAWQTETFPLSDQYVAAAQNLVLSWCYNDDSDIPGNTPRSNMYRKRGLDLLGVRATREQMNRAKR